MDVDADKEALFNEVYDTEHIPYLSKVPGVVSATRLKADTLQSHHGRRNRKLSNPPVPRYVCILELSNPDVLTSAAFATAVDAGRWATQVRPFTRNRHHTLHKVLKS